MRINTRIAARTAAAVLLAAATAPILAATAHATEQSGAICGSAWLDANENGKKDAGEPGLPNHSIGENHAGGRNVNTDANGDYCFKDLPPGTYVLQSNDRALFQPAQGWTKEGGDSDFGFVNGTSKPITVGAGQTVQNIDAGYVNAKMDVRTTQLLAEYKGNTYASDQQWLTTPVKVGEEFTIYGGVMPVGNVAEQLSAKLTVPAGLKIIGKAGGMSSHIYGQTVEGYFEQRRSPGLVEFVGVKVKVESAFDPSEIRLETYLHIYADSDASNNVLTRKISAVAAPAPATTTTTTKATSTTTKPATTTAVTTPVAKASSSGDLANTGANPVAAISIGTGLLAAGAGALLYTRKRRTNS